MSNKKMNPVVHFEMPSEDKKRTSEFYSRVFGWKMAQLDEKMGNYLLATTSPVDENNMHINKGAINGGYFNKGEYGSIPHIVIAVENLDESIKMVNELGGQVSEEPTNIPGIGMFVMFKDTEGNRVGMLQPVNM